jgi:glycosyltransferase involved in cell wall biosynthesis
MKKISCLAICPSFPPMANARSIQMGILLHFLGMNSEIDWEIICAKPETIHLSPIDAQLSYLETGINVHRVRSFESRYVRWLGNRFFPFSLLTIPDPRIGWLPLALQKLNQLLKMKHFDILCSFSTPPTSHLVALLAKREVGVPWLAFLSDPWTNVPVERAVDPVKSYINKKLEKRVFNTVDKIVFTWSQGRDWVLKDYPERIKEKSEILPQAYDKSLYNLGTIPSNLLRSPIKMRFVYAGNFYGFRTPEPLFVSLKIIQNLKNNNLDFLEIILLGSKTPPIDNLIKKYDLGNFVRSTTNIPYFDDLALLRSADVLVVIDAASDVNIYLPSKLIEYLGANRPILGITPKVGPTAEVLQFCGLPVFPPENPDAIANAILMLKELWEQKRLDEWLPKPENAAQFSVEQISKKMVNILTNLRKLHRLLSDD